MCFVLVGKETPVETDYHRIMYTRPEQHPLVMEYYGWVIISAANVEFARATKED